MTPCAPAPVGAEERAVGREGIGGEKGGGGAAAQGEERGREGGRRGVQCASARGKDVFLLIKWLKYEK